MQHTADSRADQQPGSPLRVLVVDDNRDAAVLMGKLLRALGNDVRVVHSGTDAIEATHDFSPEAVLLDIGLPDMDGYETARALREVPGSEQITIIAVTGWGQDADRARGKLAGFNHHVVKPADSTHLMGLLSSVRNKALA